MPIFKPKAKPVLRWSRLVHLLEAAAVTALGGQVFGYEGSVVTSMIAIVGGFGWELGNRWMKGDHRWGDALDFYAFCVGAVGTGIAYSLLNLGA